MDNFTDFLDILQWVTTAVVAVVVFYQRGDLLRLNHELTLANQNKFSFESERRNALLSFFDSISKLVNSVHYMWIEFTDEDDKRLKLIRADALKDYKKLMLYLFDEEILSKSADFMQVVSDERKMLLSANKDYLDIEYDQNLTELVKSNKKKIVIEKWNAETMKYYSDIVQPKEIELYNIIRSLLYPKKKS